MRSSEKEDTGQRADQSRIRREDLGERRRDRSDLSENGEFFGAQIDPQIRFFERGENRLHRILRFANRSVGGRRLKNGRADLGPDRGNCRRFFGFKGRCRRFFRPVRGFDGQKVAELPKDTPTFEKVQAAETFGKQQALKVTALIPATMAACYLLLILYFRAIGGYKLVEIGPGGEERETPYEPSAREAIYKDSQADQA